MVSGRMRRRLGWRGRRVGEASHPGPPHVYVHRPPGTYQLGGHRQAAHSYWANDGLQDQRNTSARLPLAQ